MKVLLVNPAQVGVVAKRGSIYNRKWTPLDLANCAALLAQQGVDVSILDANAEHIQPTEVARRSRGYDKVFVTSTSLDRWQCPQLDISLFLETARTLSNAVPEVYIMGSHGTVKPEDMLRETGARAVIRGEPERTVLDLCNSRQLSDVRGVTFDNGNSVLTTKDQRPVNLNELPLPAFHLLPMDRYYYELMGDRFTLLEMSRGCAGNCAFCLLETYGHGVRRKKLDNIIPEIEYVIKEFGVRNAYFMDLEFTILRKQVIELCRYLIKKQYTFSWCCQTRFDLIDEELLGLMKRAGCRLIHFGVEAASDEALQLLEKGITIRQIEEGMRMVTAAGIDTAWFLLVGFPGYTRADLDQALSFAKKHNPTYASFRVAVPYPGTKLYETVQGDPSHRFSDSSLFPQAIEGQYSIQELKGMARSAFLQYYLRPSYVMSRLQRGDVRSLATQVRLFWGYVRS